MTKYYIAWNEDKTCGVITTDPQLAYEARKGAETNCVHERKNEHIYQSKTAIGFCQDTIKENCSIETFCIEDFSIIIHDGIYLK